MNARISSCLESTVLIFGVALLTGCGAWQTQLDPPDVALSSRPARARITTSDGTRTTLRWPAVHDGLLTGTTTATSEYGDKRDGTVTIPLDSVTRTELHGLSSGRTMTLFLTVFGVITVLAVVGASSGPLFTLGPTF